VNKKPSSTCDKTPTRELPSQLQLHIQWQLHIQLHSLLHIRGCCPAAGKSYKNKYTKNGCRLELASQSLNDHNDKRIGGSALPVAYDLAASRAG